jgi:hypothetical protein
VSGSAEQGKEPSGSIKGIFIDQLREYQRLKDDPAPRN